ncbi:MAG: glycosyltransferase family 10 [Thermanaerothrix sp.]|nr:glycosyltransferase family 10 [Thermanaerothrix sp.]
MKVKVTTQFPEWPLRLQSPSGLCQWDGVRFFIDDDTDEADAWVVFDNVKRTVSALCPPEKVVLITFEPPAIKSYPSSYLKQFARVVTCHNMDHPGVIRWQQSLPWHYGRNLAGQGEDRFLESYDTLSADDPFSAKERLASIVCSAKRSRDCHRRRHEFVSLLEEARIEGLEFFGRGRPVEAPCKRDAIRPYKYHVVLENSSYPDYWSEKLADAYLGGAFPIYWGCPNLEDYFPEGSFARIDIERPKEAVERIREILGSSLYEDSIEALRKARDLVLNRYNFFPAMASLLKEIPGGSPRMVIIKPEELFTLRGMVRRVRLKVKRMLGAECDLR